MFAQIALIAAQMTSSTSVGYDRITPQAAAERVARCGAGPASVRSMKEIDVDVLVVAAERIITDKQIVCIAQAASVYDVELPPDAQPRLDAITMARSEAFTKAEGARWLAAHELLTKLPVYQAGMTDDEEFARKIETLCRANGALQSRYGVHALSPEWGMKNVGDPAEDGPFACVLNVASASGFELGFIGNEQSTR